ncbi:MAG: SMP-30/gluconolactonase/LRE family protein [Polyangiales bacterium]
MRDRTTTASRQIAGRISAGLALTFLLLAGPGCGSDAASGTTGASSASKRSSKNVHASAIKPTAAKDAGTDGAAPTSVSYDMLDAAQIGAPVKLALSKTLTLAEGPLWDPCEHRLLFVDVTASVIYALGSDGELSEFMTDTKNANGIAFDPTDGSLVMAQMGGNPGHVMRRDKDGTVHQVDPDGSMLHTPDDVIVRSDGTIYFSDGEFPPIGSLNLSPLPVYEIPKDASMLVNGGTVAGPNGIELSPDERTLYVDAYFGGQVVEFDVASDGSLTKGDALVSGLASPDSLCLDAAGNLYVGVSTGLQVLRPDGSKVALIPIGSPVTNCTFGDDDGKTLYITAWTNVWKVEGMPIPGLDFVANTARLKCGA